MNKKLELLLVKKYPNIFREYNMPMEKSCMHWGFEHNDGWFHIINKACINIQKVCNKYNIDFTATQMKEKFGALRWYYVVTEKNPNQIDVLDRIISRKFYKYKLGRLYNKLNKFRENIYQTPSEKIATIINKAERDSLTTCEICGDPGRRVGKWWLRTVCPKCENKKE